MSQRYRHRRTFSPGTAFPSPIEPGEIAVNTANRQIAVGDAAAGVLGVPLPLLGVRIFDARASYATNDYVVQGGSFYRAKSAINPGAFNPAQWDVMSTDAAVKAYADAGDAAVSAAFAAADTTITTNYQAADTALNNAKVAKAGDTMTGPLVLPVAAPTSDPQAANKKYVDDKIASIPTPSSLTVSDTPPVGVPDGALWWESDSGLLYVRYNDGNTTQWVIAAPQPDINAFALANTVVRYDTAQSLTAAQQQQARQNIYAAPFDAMAYSGLQINGAMEVSQEKGAAATTASGGYVCDGWILGFGGTMVPASAISNQSAKFPGFSSSIYINLSTAQTTLGANDFVTLTQKIEGYRTSRLMWGTPSAQPITLCFWSAHHRPGLYSGSIRNGAANRSYAFTYTQAVPDVQQYNVVTIPGDTSGTWTIDNSLGIALVFAMACGSTYTAPSANAWVAGSYAAAPGQINGVASTTDVFLITGVTVLPGSEAPLYARSPFVMRSYDQELVICRRYYEVDNFGSIFSGNVTSGQNYYVAAKFTVEKRVTPTVTLAAGASNSFPAAVGTVVASNNSFYETRIANISSVGWFQSSWKADARL